MFIALALGFSVSGNAADIVVGSVSCKEWIEDRAGSSDSFNKNVDQSWVISFLNGYSKTTKIKFLTNVRSEYVFNWMDKYCTSHQQNKINDGALVLAHHIYRKDIRFLLKGRRFRSGFRKICSSIKKFSSLRKIKA